MRITYKVYGETRIPERGAPWLDGYRGSGPVRIGNGAANQFQLDVYGDVMEALEIYQRSDGGFDRDGKALLRGIAAFVMQHWANPDEGIWEVRSGRAQHTHSKAMAWTALDRLITIDPRSCRVVPTLHRRNPVG